MSKLALEISNLAILIIGVGLTVFAVYVPKEKENNVAIQASFLAGVGARGLTGALIDRYQDDED